jgi:hypothetical protein
VASGAVIQIMVIPSAIKTLVPALVGGVQQNVDTKDIDSSGLESAVTQQGASGLLDGGVSVDQVDAKQGEQFVSKIFGGNDSGQVASALAGTGAGNSDLIKKLLPVLAPIVLACSTRAAQRRHSRRVAPRREVAVRASCANPGTARS